MSKELLQRFTYLERIVHWVVGATFVALLLTGLAFAYPSFFWLTTLVGGGPARTGYASVDRERVRRWHGFHAGTVDSRYVPGPRRLAMAGVRA